MKNTKKTIKRMKLNHKKFLRFITVTLLLTISILFLISNSASGRQEFLYKTVVIKSGDTLWKVAQNNNNYDNMEEYIDKIYKINKLDNSNVYPGQRILIPKY